MSSRLGTYFKVTGAALSLVTLFGCAGVRDSKGTVRAWSLNPGQGMRLDERTGRVGIDSTPGVIFPGYYSEYYTGYGRYPYCPYAGVPNSNMGMVNGPVGRYNFK